jgi:hypothetical protein
MTGLLEVGFVAPAIAGGRVYLVRCLQVIDGPRVRELSPLARPKQLLMILAKHVLGQGLDQLKNLRP